jgi:hypothetical protein
MKNSLLLFSLLFLTACGSQAERDWITTDGFTWKSPVPEDCPFEPSQTLRGVYFTGRHSDYKAGDTFYPSWASDRVAVIPTTDLHGTGRISDRFRDFRYLMISAKPGLSLPIRLKTLCSRNLRRCLLP